METSTVLDNFRLSYQLDAGRDGASYIAIREADGETVEVRMLTGLEPESLELWERRLRLLQLLHHDALAALEAYDLQTRPPFAIFKKPADHALSDFIGQLLPHQCLAAAWDLVSAIHAAHRLGLSHGRLNPANLGIHEGRLLADLSGLQTRQAADVRHDRWEAFAAPELASRFGDMPADVYSLGKLVPWILNAGECSPTAGAPSIADSRTLRELGLEASPSLESLVAALEEALVTEPTDRPPVRHVLAVLKPLMEESRRAVTQYDVSETAPGTVHAADMTGTFDEPSVLLPIGESPSINRLEGSEIGRYRVERKLGEGGMGCVYLAEDRADNHPVALKVLSPRISGDAHASRRFQKEARLLAAAQNPYIANLLEINEDRGLQFIAMEFIEGSDLKEFLNENGPLDESLALHIAADIARALAGVHQRGIIHRDIKPSNVLLQQKDTTAETVSGDETAVLAQEKPVVKLTDFGLARHIDQTHSMDLTRTGGFMGTPKYMAPEQTTMRGDISPATDVYSLGVTLFELLAGRLPFTAEEPLLLARQHCDATPPALRSVNPRVSEAAERIVAKALAKDPGERYADAAHMLEDLDRLLRGEPAHIAIHPILPDAGKRRIFESEFQWELESAPEDLWPHVSNTERLNCAIGLPSVEYTTKRDQNGLHKMGSFRLTGIEIAWEEHPFEWIEGQRLGVLREFTRGPFLWFLSVVELSPRPGGGTTLFHRVKIAPRGLAGRWVAKMEVDLKGRRSLDRVYRRIDAAVSGKLSEDADPFEKPASLSSARNARLEAALGRLATCNIEVEVVERLGDYIRKAPAQELARMRPVVLARNLDLRPDDVLAGCLHGTREGLLELHWDILCPTCRVPATFSDTLREIERHSYCEFCDVDFEVDFSRSLELFFRVHPEIRPANLGSYCVGGPEHSPHVVAQLRLSPGEVFEMSLSLCQGAYALRGPQLPYTVPLSVEPVRGITRGKLELSEEFDPDQVPILHAGRQVLTVTNGLRHPLLLRLERSTEITDVVTAAQASANSLFVELFPNETLRSDQLIHLSAISLLLCAPDDADGSYAEFGDATAFELMLEQRRAIGEGIREAGGAVCREDDAETLAVFQEPIAAVRAALALRRSLMSGDSPFKLGLRQALHRGTALVTHADRGVAYHGRTVSLVGRLLEMAERGEIILSDAMTRDPEVAALLREEGLTGEIFTPKLAGNQKGVATRLT